ncbi:MAG: metallophosphoesterase [Synergistes sp.]|nr:metallophosphoesterase [Synergistes sp.]
MDRRFAMFLFAVAVFILCMFAFTSYRIGTSFSACAGFVWLAVSLLSVAAIVIFKVYSEFPAISGLRLFVSKSCHLWIVFVFLTLASMCILDVVRFTIGIECAARTECTAALAAALLLMAIGSFEARSADITTLRIVTDKLPPDVKHLRVAAVSDLHIGSLTGDGHIDEIVRCTESAKPDILLLAGDITDTPIDKSEAIAAAFRRIKAPLGIFAVLGNHDGYGNMDETKEFMSACGIEIVENEYREVGGIVVEGVGDLDHTEEDEWGLSRSEKHIVNTKNKFRDKFIVLLRHRPVVETCTQGLFDLQISGHFHGGQIVPLPWSRLKIRGHSRGFRKLLRGSLLYTTNGISCSIVHIRIFAPPEIVIIDIVNKNASK